MGVKSTFKHRVATMPVLTVANQGGSDIHLWIWIVQVGLFISLISLVIFLPYLSRAEKAVSFSKRENTEPPTIHTVDLNMVGAWCKGLLVHDETPLSDVVYDLERYLGIDITITDIALGYYPVSAVLQVKEKSKILNALVNTFNLEIDRDSKNQVTIKKNLLRN